MDNIDMLAKKSAYHMLFHVSSKTWISNAELLERSDMSDIKLTINQRKWRWFGHTLRKGHDNVTNQALTWRKPAGPKTTWRREFLDELKDDENHCAWPML